MTKGILSTISVILGFTAIIVGLAVGLGCGVLVWQSILDPAIENDVMLVVGTLVATSIVTSLASTLAMGIAFIPAGLVWAAAEAFI